MFWIVFILYFLINTFVFRFQRTTLSISREHLGQNYPKYQMILTPKWVGVLGWINKLLMLFSVVFAFVFYGLVSIFLVLLYSFIGTALVDTITPWPSYSKCFEIIEKWFTQDKSLSKKDREEILKLIRLTKSKYKA